MTTLQCEQINLADIRVWFDYPEFVVGIVALIKGEELTPANRHALQMFNAEIQVTTDGKAELTHAQRILSGRGGKFVCL